MNACRNHMGKIHSTLAHIHEKLNQEDMMIENYNLAINETSKLDDAFIYLSSMIEVLRTTSTRQTVFSFELTKVLEKEP